ncbi:transient receptor potential cation channel subfamily V member 3-like [Vombatus ursinus]|uniref:transient receptor potential cation channel subfamily V member 3-like n=1 Tax=Vombatus ursinus TaxID=29139 RepID=UPI000FFD569F|nr:transient receptor potential cation channel subfamily V member 3-like [Vombatus ursinus]XP_027705462.1 transient receptor potential cation channel subfamily V member 3-like [Vombatus ursinus]
MSKNPKEMIPLMGKKTSAPGAAPVCPLERRPAEVTPTKKRRLQLSAPKHKTSCWAAEWASYLRLDSAPSLLLQCLFLS